MTIKKMLLLGSMALAAVALAVPATASAQLTWTDWNGTSHVHLAGGAKAQQAFEGTLSFDAGGTNTFGCEVTARIEAEGPAGGKVLEFEPTTETCVGTGALFAGCVLENHSSNVPWNMAVGAANVVITKTGADVTVTNLYKAGSCPNPPGLTSSHLEFASVTIDPTLNGQKTITGLKVTGTATNGAVATGELFPEGDLTLGLT